MDNLVLRKALHRAADKWIERDSRDLIWRADVHHFKCPLMAEPKRTNTRLVRSIKYLG